MTIAFLCDATLIPTKKIPDGGQRFFEEMKNVKNIILVRLVYTSPIKLS